jgi:hypothetical protein
VGTGNLAVYKTFEHLGFVYAQDRGRVFVYAPDGRAVCGARRWGTNGEVPCMARPKRNGRCRTHGGNARVGEDASNYKHGRYFRDLPPDLQRRFEAALADEDLLSTRQDVALLDTRVGEAIKGLQTGEAGELWGRLREAWAELYAVRMSGELELIVTYIDSVNRIIRQGINHQKAWAEVVALLGARTKLVESERKYLVEKGQMVPVEQVMLMLGVVQDIIARHVQDRGALAAIGREFQRLADPPDSEWVLGPPRREDAAAGDPGPGRDRVELESVAPDDRGQAPP